jgi:surfeit locus 1 family protein
LGSWQLVRREKKIELLNFRRARFEEDPIALEEALAIKKHSSDAEDVLQYRKVYCEGVLDETKSLFVGPRSRTLYGAAEKGYYVVTPLICKSKSDDRVQLPVLVNRGWVPSNMRNEALAQEQPAHSHPPAKDVTEEKQITKQNSWWSRWGRSKATDQEEVVVEAKPTLRVAGVIRDGEQPNMFVPNNQPEIGQWFYVDVPAMARTLGLPEDVTYMEAVAASSPDREGRKKFPLPKESDSFLKSSVMPQDHLNYALTWYTLSAATTFMAVKRLQSRKRGR